MVLKLEKKASLKHTFLGKYDCLWVWLVMICVTKLQLTFVVSKLSYVDTTVQVISTGVGRCVQRSREAALTCYQYRSVPLIRPLRKYAPPLFSAKVPAQGSLTRYNAPR